MSSVVDGAMEMARNIVKQVHVRVIKAILEDKRTFVASAGGAVVCPIIVLD